MHDAIEQVRDAAADDEAQSRGHSGCLAPELAKKKTIQSTTAVVRTITSEVACEKNPKAIPEFCTWLI